jgi:OOP family OmpA-OmpF porin
VRVYLNGTRLIDVNQVHPGVMDHLYLEESQGTFELRSVRIAESAPDPGDVLATTGKFVTHGIYFDTDSDILKPASAGVIKEISTALYKHPDMKVEIDGYTDSTGNASHNQDLSARRAAAVMKVLVEQFGIDQSRLTAKGFGSKNPISSNNTSEGRAKNRRVEFIKK